MEHKKSNKIYDIIFLIAVLLLSVSVMSSIGVWNNRSFYFDEYIYNSYSFPAQTQYCADLSRFLSGEMTEKEKASFQSGDYGVYYHVTNSDTKEVFGNIPRQMDHTEFSALPNIKTFFYINQNSSVTGNSYTLIEEVPDNSRSYPFSGYIFIDIDAGASLSGFLRYMIETGFKLQKILYIESALFVISFVLGGIALIASLVGMKKTPVFADRIPLDVIIAAPAIAAMVWIFIISTYLHAVRAYPYLRRRIILYTVLTGLTFVILFSLICLIFKICEYAAEKPKLRRDWENRLTKNTPPWLIGLVLQLIWYFVVLAAFSPRPYFYDYSLMLKNNILIIIVHNAVILSVFLFISKLQRAKDIYSEEVLRAAREIAGGNLAQIIPVSGTSRYEQIAAAANTIREGYIRALDEQKKSERLKYELVTNISHDLRTPLTSILNYIGLIKKSGAPDNIERYIDHVDANAKKLNLLIEDLFELSKIESGNIELDISEADIILLLKQAAHEYEAQLKQNNLEIIFSFGSEHYPIQCDNIKIWRVIDNIINNAVKYSLSGTRIYVSAARESGETGRLLISVKNIASYKMNFESEELFLRFKRGDESRSTEGSGLGLAIARGLTELHKGSIHIEIEGDMFKVIICL